jgi:hypothetical protein
MPSPPAGRLEPDCDEFEAYDVRVGRESALRSDSLPRRDFWDFHFGDHHLNPVADARGLFVFDEFVQDAVY